LAIQTRTPIAEFLGALVKPGHDFCSDYDEHRIGINALKGNLPAGVNENDGRDIIIKKADLEFARNDIEHTSIWPVIIHEALKAIDEETRPDNTLLIDMGYREKTFDCQRANAPYLCRVSVMNGI
jgi:hypothetical protein